jgi:ABC-2 type transport system permease protein
VTRYLRIVAIQLRVSAAAAMAYRADFLIEGVMSVFWLTWNLLPLVVLYGDRAMIRGWDYPSALVLTACFIALRAVLEGVISPSLVEVVARIRTGAFDYILLKPVDAQLQISTLRFEPWKIVDLLGAVGLGAYAFVRLGHGPAPGDLAAGLGLLLAGGLAMYALWLTCAAASFWVVRLDNLTFLLGSLFDTARWPVQIFRGAWRVIFTFVIPVALMTTVPAMALLGHLRRDLAFAALGGAAVLLALSRLIWRAAIRNYTSASS